MSLYPEEKVFIGIGVVMVTTLGIWTHYAFENKKELERIKLKESVFKQLSSDGLNTLSKAPENSLFRLKISTEEEVLLFKEKGSIAVLDTREFDIVSAEVNDKKQLLLKRKNDPKDFKIFEKDHVDNPGRGEGRRSFLKGRITIKEIQDQYNLKQKNEDKLQKISSRKKNRPIAQNVVLAKPPYRTQHRTRA